MPSPPVPQVPAKLFKVKPSLRSRSCLLLGLRTAARVLPRWSRPSPSSAAMPDLACCVCSAPASCKEILFKKLNAEPVVQAAHPREAAREIRRPQAGNVRHGFSSCSCILCAWQNLAELLCRLSAGENFCSSAPRISSSSSSRLTMQVGALGLSASLGPLASRRLLLLEQPQGRERPLSA